MPSYTINEPHPSVAQNAYIHAGRGGAGNAHSAAERVAMSFDDEYAEAARHAAASTGHVGRGGAGNTFGSVTSAVPGSSSAVRRDSASTNGSERSGFWGRLSTSAKR